jgi:hypothetical protein
MWGFNSQKTQKLGWTYSKEICRTPNGTYISRISYFVNTNKMKHFILSVLSTWPLMALTEPAFILLQVSVPHNMLKSRTRCLPFSRASTKSWISVGLQCLRRSTLPSGKPYAILTYHNRRTGMYCLLSYCSPAQDYRNFTSHCSHSCGAYRLKYMLSWNENEMIDYFTRVIETPSISFALIDFLCLQDYANI